MSLDHLLHEIESETGSGRSRSQAMERLEQMKRLWPGTRVATAGKHVERNRMASLGSIVLLLLTALSGTARADTLATVTAAGNEIRLLTERCGTDDSRMQRAERHRGSTRLRGCWSVNTRSNPVILWSDGSVQEIAASRVRLAEKYAAMLEDAPADVQPNSARADFPRAAWCSNARFSHERLVCRDPELATADLALAPLWRAYRRDLTEVQRAQAKSDYFRRLEACGANKACIQREQAAQAHVYRTALGER